jgi:hypothetical protein
MFLFPVLPALSFKKYFLASVIILTGHSCCSQSLTEEAIWKGLERFKLGTSKVVFENKLVPVVGGVDSTGKEKTYLYSYNPGPDSPIIFAGIRFSQASLKFNDAGRLNTIELHAFYFINNTSINHKDAEKHSKQVLSYLENRLNKGSKHNQKDNTGWRIAREYEWQKDGRRLIFVQHIKKANQSSQSGSSFSVWLSDSQ